MLSVATIVSADRQSELGLLEANLRTLDIPIEWSVVINQQGTKDEYSYSKATTNGTITFKVINATYTQLDFGKLKNIALNQCTKDWVLVLDSDDYVASSPKEFKDTINELANVQGLESVNVNVLCPINLGNKVNVQYIKSPRLLRNFIRYKNMVHEQPILTKESIDSTLLINHSGYKEHNAKVMIPKIKRNIDLLIKNLQYDTDNEYLHMMLAEAYKDLQKNNLLPSVTRVN